MPRTPSIDRGYLDLPSAYYTETPTRATFSTALDDGPPPASPIQKVFQTLHERRKSRAEIEEEKWFGGLVDIEEQERKRREMCAVVGVVCAVGGLVGVWWFCGGS